MQETENIETHKLIEKAIIRDEKEMVLSKKEYPKLVALIATALEKGIEIVVVPKVFAQSRGRVQYTTGLGFAVSDGNRTRFVRYAEVRRLERVKMKLEAFYGGEK